MLKEVRTASLEARKKITEDANEKPKPKPTEEKKQKRLPTNVVNQLEQEFMTDEELEDSSEEVTEGTETSIVADTEESSSFTEAESTSYAEVSRGLKEETSSEDQVVKMEHWRIPECAAEAWSFFPAENPLTANTDCPIVK